MFHGNGNILRQLDDRDRQIGEVGRPGLGVQVVDLRMDVAQGGHVRTVTGASTPYLSRGGGIARSRDVRHSDEVA